ncbi:MAG: hypothetical protein U0905_11570 [Pirellulales bacterium]
MARIEVAGGLMSPATVAERLGWPGVRDHSMWSDTLVTASVGPSSKSVAHGECLTHTMSRCKQILA